VIMMYSSLQGGPRRGGDVAKILEGKHTGAIERIHWRLRMDSCLTATRGVDR